MVKFGNRTLFNFVLILDSQIDESLLRMGTSVFRGFFQNRSIFDVTLTSFSLPPSSYLRLFFQPSPTSLSLFTLPIQIQLLTLPGSVPR